MKGDESGKQNSLSGKPPKLEITQGGSWGWGQFSTLNCLHHLDSSNQKQFFTLYHPFIKEQFRPREVMFLSKITQHTENPDWGPPDPLHILKDS